QFAYALSNYYRSKGIVTVLGGPHARCYPEDACLYFDYVMGLTNKALLIDLLHNFELNKSFGSYLTAASQPETLPGVRQRWEFIEKIHKKMPVIKIIPMIGSLGCPYNCDFCIDSDIPYQVLDMEEVKEDLAFLVKTKKHPRVGWFDPNFGVQFDLFMDTIESVVPPGTIDFVAECSLSILNERNVKRLQRNGFVAIMPGIESWFEYGKKSKMGSKIGMEKVKKAADQVNLIQKYIPQVHINFMFGFDSDAGELPFTLTKHFIDLVPGAYPSYQILSIFGQSTQSNFRYENENRIIPFPFHMLRTVHTLNVIPENYTWEAFNMHMIDLLKYSFSPRAIYRRFTAIHYNTSRWITLFMSLTVGGTGKIRFLSDMVKHIRKDQDFQAFLNKESPQVPQFMREKVKKDLGPLWYWLPDKSLSYNPNVLSRAKSYYDK
ncbi:MAG: radical SAM protein, partial [Bacteroidales bacterium]|nr:radical SAM protein [Bacteroidales bacterium]